MFLPKQRFKTRKDARSPLEKKNHVCKSYVLISFVVWSKNFKTGTNVAITVSVILCFERRFGFPRWNKNIGKNLLDAFAIRALQRFVERHPVPRRIYVHISHIYVCTYLSDFQQERTQRGSTMAGYIGGCGVNNTSCCSYVGDSW